MIAAEPERAQEADAAPLAATLDWSAIEVAGAPLRPKRPIHLDDQTRTAIAAELLAAVRAAGKARAAAQSGDPIADGQAALKSLRAALANLPAITRAAPDALDAVAAAALDAGRVLHAVAAAKARAEKDVSALSPFHALVARIAPLYARSGVTPSAAVALERLPKDGEASEDAYEKPERPFVRFLRALLLDAETVLLGLPTPPSLRRVDSGFTRDVRAALAKGRTVTL